MFGVISFPQKDTKDILNKDHHMFNAFGNFEHSNTFNLVGLQPVSEVGKSFSVQSNEYYPLWFFAVQAVCSRLDIDKKKMLLGYFSENEFNVQMNFSAFESQVIGVQIQLLLEDEQLTSTLINTMNSIGSGEADGLECPFCKASGWICISENQHIWRFLNIQSFVFLKKRLMNLSNSFTTVEVFKLKVFFNISFHLVNHLLIKIKRKFQMFVIKKIEIDEGVSIEMIEEIHPQQSDMDNILEVIDLTEDSYQVLEVLAS